ncbi:MAG TPA: phasin family protein [Bradyrhizobium sp.]|nr:phasin family protein [Bradyrhizobium sp.]
MPTTPQDKSGAKPRQRNRKTDQRNATGEPPADLKPADQDHIASRATSVEAAASGSADVSLRGEVLLPEPRSAGAVPSSNTIGVQSVVQTYADDARQSWLAGRSLIERWMTARSFEEAIEIQGELAKLAYANFLAHSLRFCEFYGALTRPFFVPLEHFRF